MLSWYRGCSDSYSFSVLSLFFETELHFKKHVIYSPLSSSLTALDPRHCVRACSSGERGRSGGRGQASRRGGVSCGGAQAVGVRASWAPWPAGSRAQAQ